MNSASDRRSPAPRPEETLVVVRLSALGDVIHALPAVQQLHENFPQSPISWVCSPAAARLLNCFNLDARLLPLKIRGRSLPGLIRELKGYRNALPKGHTLALDFQGLIKSALVARVLTPRVLGFHRDNLREPLAAWCYRFHASRYPESRHVIFKNLHLLTSLGIAPGQAAYPPLRSAEASQRLQAFMKAHDLESTRFALINTGGGWPTKVPATEMLARLGRWLKMRMPAVLLWGNEEERARAEQISRSCGLPPAPPTDFSDLGILLQAAGLVISGDTLALHLADALGTPSVGLFAPTSPGRNGSLLPGSRSVTTALPCRGCFRRRCSRTNCMSRIPFAAVEEAVSQVIHDNR